MKIGKIERGVPLPLKKESISDVLFRLKVGDSIFIEECTNAEILAIRSAMYDPARKSYRGKGAYVSKSIDNGLRIWRARKQVDDDNADKTKKGRN